jgi:UDP-N-acetylglucosamine 1-carboxyvinyltransferase
MKCLKVEQQQKEVSGTISVPGSKNSALALVAAACMADEPVTLLGMPNISDLRVISEITKEIGCSMYRDESGAFIVDPRKIQNPSLDSKKSSLFRTAYYFIGALLGKHGKVSLGYPGGDDFVSRPIDQHVKSFQMMGATFTFHKEHYVVEAKELKGTSIYFDKITSGGTINAMLGAVLAKGETVLLNAACDPEVTDTAILLNKMGASISGAGTSTIRINGVTKLTGCTHRVIPDRLIAGAFLMTSGMRGGSVTVQDIIPEHLQSCISKLREIGLEFDINEDSITSNSDGKLKAARVRTGMYPGFATDLQQPLTALLTQASGKSIISEKIYPHRFNHVPQLMKMGADMKVRSGVAFVKGKANLHHAIVHASDIRAGICLILAGMAAEGGATITGLHHIERGYENVIKAFQTIGANLTIKEIEEPKQVDYQSLHA